MSREAMQQALEALENAGEAVYARGGIAAVGSLNIAAQALRQALETEQEPVAWMQIDTAPKGQIVLVHYKNSLGNGRTMRARYYLPETLDSDSTESGWADEGWYEESEAYEYLMPLEYEPTHWMPLPAAPDTQPLYTAPSKQWVGLTDQEINSVCYKRDWTAPWTNTTFARAIEQALKEKNGGEYRNWATTERTKLNQENT